MILQTDISLINDPNWDGKLYRATPKAFLSNTCFESVEGILYVNKNDPNTKYIRCYRLGGFYDFKVDNDSVEEINL
jgi:hypothetical protein